MNTADSRVGYLQASDLDSILFAYVNHDLSAPVGQSLSLLAAAWPVGDGHFEKARIQCWLQVVTTEMHTIFQFKSTPQFSTCHFSFRGGDELLDLRGNLRGDLRGDFTCNFTRGFTCDLVPT